MSKHHMDSMDHMAKLDSMDYMNRTAIMDRTGYMDYIDYTDRTTIMDRTDNMYRMVKLDCTDNMDRTICMDNMDCTARMIPLALSLALSYQPRHIIMTQPKLLLARREEIITFAHLTSLMMLHKGKVAITIHNITHMLLFVVSTIIVRYEKCPLIPRMNFHILH